MIHTFMHLDIPGATSVGDAAAIVAVENVAHE